MLAVLLVHGRFRMEVSKDGELLCVHPPKSPQSHML